MERRTFLYATGEIPGLKLASPWTDSLPVGGNPCLS
jgi:hypothetical protein